MSDGTPVGTGAQEGGALDSPPGPVGQFSATALSRAFRVFGEPAEVFRELSTSPTWAWALLLLILVSFGLSMLIAPKIDFEATIRKGIEDRGSQAQQLTDEQISRIAETQRKVASVMRYASPATVSLVFLLLGGAYFLGLKAAGSEVEYTPVFSAVVHATLPASLVSGALMVVMASQRDSFPAQEMERLLKTSVGAWLDPATPKALLTVANSLDIFNLWQWILLTVGLAIVGKVSRSRSALVVAVLWGIWVAGRAAISSFF
ncbi:MAG: YIP1 family protein [Acidobacteriota bacterium]